MEYSELFRNQPRTPVGGYHAGLALFRSVKHFFG